jgi:hypothetical protein
MRIQPLQQSPSCISTAWRSFLLFATEVSRSRQVHGGPWARDTWSFNPLVQLLTSRGYVSPLRFPLLRTRLHEDWCFRTMQAVLRINYRGSSGFGKSFLNKGNLEWGVGAMQRDLTEAVTWAINWGIADRNKVAIMGGSYGGESKPGLPPHEIGRILSRSSDRQGTPHSRGWCSRLRSTSVGSTLSGPRISAPCSRASPRTGSP